MNTEIDLGSMPLNYMKCTNASCAKCHTCLRYLAYESLPDSEVSLKIVNPKLLSQQTDECPYFRSSKKIRYAKGFIEILESLPNKIWKSVSGKLQYLYNGRNYYRVRKGEKLLTPKEQERIIAIIRQHGVKNIPDFDAYVDDYAW